MPRAGTAAGPACKTCREKCRKCDRGRPKCQRCISKGLECGGYPDQYRFCGIASRGRWKGARVPTPRNSKAESSIAESQQVSTTATPGSDAPGRTEGVATRPSSKKPSRSATEVPDDIPKILNLTQTEMLLSHYESFICPHQIAEIGGTSSNPYRAYILPLARKQIGLLYAILGLSASHLGKLTGNMSLYEEAAVEYRLRAIRALSEEIRKSQGPNFLHEDEQDAVLAIIQILLLHDIAETGISTHGIHITGAMSVCKQLLLADGLNSRRRRAVFFLGNLAWLDIIRAFAGPERLCFSQDIRETVASATDEMFELVNGCPREIFLVIGAALEKAKEYNLGWLSWDEYQVALQSAKHKLYSFDRTARTYPSSDPRWMSTAEAFQYACILRVLRLLNPLQQSRSNEIQECVARILDATARIPSDCCLLELLVFPLFMGGSEALSPHSQYYVIARLNEIERRSEFRNPVPRELLEKVWAARAAQASGDDRNISWTTFTHSPELTQQHDYLII
ncbi:C6 zinc finger domain protein [Aspergillus udagawae]|nr:C6 zinc finger domain protein [Aspergillus udagawae]